MNLPRIGALLLAAAPSLAVAATFEAYVTQVGDGDTLWVRPVRGGPPQQVRVVGIDAPEICQAFGPEAREALASLVMRKRVTVSPRARDQFERTLARVHLGREDVGATMVAGGYAWSYRFRGNPGPYRSEEAAARRSGAGLWAAPGAQSPRDFRMRHGSCR